MRRLGLEGQIAQFVHDQQFGFGEVHEPVLKPAFRMRLGELRHERRRRHEEGGVARQNGFTSERNSKMGFTNAWRSEQQHILAIGI
jgi:hypothetical protein